MPQEQMAFQVFQKIPIGRKDHLFLGGNACEDWRKCFNCPLVVSNSQRLKPPWRPFSGFDGTICEDDHRGYPDNVEP